jgi:hypothetical protein
MKAAMIGMNTPEKNRWKTRIDVLTDFVCSKYHTTMEGTNHA